MNIQDKVLGATANPNFRAPKCPEVPLSSVLPLQEFFQGAAIDIPIAGIVVQAPDTMTLPADTPIQPIQQARLELVLNELRHYWCEETVQAAAPLIEDLDLEIKSVTYIKPNEDENID